MKRLRAALAAASAALGTLVAGCGGGASGEAKTPATAGAGQAPPPPTVGVVTVAPQTVSLVSELPGRLEARRTAQVRARVSGIVQQRLFTEGAEVRAGEPLYRLDAGTFEAQLASAQAKVARAEAALAQAQAQVERNRPLAEAKAISAQEWLATQTTARVAQADLQTARAAVQAARINRDYTTIAAPVAGRIGRSLVSEGALVGPADPAPMATIQQIDPLYVNFTQSAAELLQLSRALDAGQLKRTAGASVEVRIVLPDGSVHPQPARLLFTDPTVDAATGQVSLRAELPNPRGLLPPGLFVRVRLAQAAVDKGIRLPQQAVTREASGDTVLVVGPDRKPSPRRVRIAGAVEGDWLVLEGLNPGEQVIVDGFQKMFVPGAPVSPVPWTRAAPAGAGPRSGATAASAPAGPAPSGSAQAASGPARADGQPGSGGPAAPTAAAPQASR